MVQDFTERPSRSTVQAPQCEVSQPMCGPVRPRPSRRKWTSSVRGSTWALTGLSLTVIVSGACSPSSLPPPRGLARAMARPTITPATWRLNSAGPRVSEPGEPCRIAATAAATARLIGRRADQGLARGLDPDAACQRGWSCATEAVESGRRPSVSTIAAAAVA